MKSVWDKKFEEYKILWERNGIKSVERELKSLRAMLGKHKDSFFHECHPDELSDGDKVMALKDVIALLSRRY